MKKILFLILCIWCSYWPLYGQIITTVAGGATGHGGYWGEGGLATDAQLNIFGGVAVDKWGNIYIAQPNRIVKVDATTGIIHTVAGTGVAGYNGDGIPATTAQLNESGFVVVDSAGNFYIGDGNNYRIRKVDVATGIITTFAGNGTLGFSGDGGPATAADFDFGAFTFDVSGNMIVEAVPDHRIRKIDPSGIITTIAGTGVTGNTGDGGLATAATMTPDGLGICTDKYGNIYFTDSFYALRKINVSIGIITRVAGVGDFMGYPYSGEGGLATDAHIIPLAVAVDDTGNLYMDDYANSRIEKVDTFGIIHTIAGDGTQGYSGDGGPATAAELYYPENVALDACNNVYIADFNNARVRKVTYPSNTLALTNTITASPGDMVCTGSGVTYSATVTSGIGGVAYSYQWYVNGTIVSTTGSSYSYTPANGDNVQCVVAGSQECSGNDTVSSNTINMVVTPVMVPTITVTAPASALAGSVVTVDATVTGAGSSYGINWYDNGVLFRTTTTPMVSYVKDTGVDVITATVVPGSEGCYDTANSNAVSVSAGNEEAPSISPQGGGLSVFPNPVGDVLNIVGQDIAKVTVSNVLGQVVFTTPFPLLKSGVLRVVMAPFASGVYVVEVTDGDGVRRVVKIIKE